MPSELNVRAGGASLGAVVEEAIAQWLSALPDRGGSIIGELGLVLSSDIGITRNQNQDRTAALRIMPPDGSPPFAAIALSDGMGGMANGAECAILTIAGFFSFLAQNTHLPAHSRIHSAAISANDLVHNYAGGKGGATLSAVMISGDGPAISVNVGDSRIYGFPSVDAGLRRLSTDDTIHDAFGGHSQELVQFIGIGPALLPHVADLPVDLDSIFLTTDGVHFIDPHLIEEVARNAPDLKRTVDRLLALARWLGGRDNASMAAFSKQSIVDHLRRDRFLDCTVWGITNPLQFVRFFPNDNRTQTGGQQDRVTSASPKRSRSTRGPVRKSRKRSTNKDQLQITIDNSANDGGTQGDDS